MLDFIDPSLAVFVFLALLVVFILFKTVLIVPNQQAVVIERLGKFHAVLFAGFHILIPFIDAVAYRRSLKEDVLDVPKQTCITRDNVSVEIDGVLYLQVVNPEKSAYGISDYMFGSVQLAQTALRCAIGKLELDRTFEERSTINQEVISALDAATAPWGIKVLRYEIRDITPPSGVMEAMEKQMRAEENKTQHRENQSQTNHGRSPFVAALSAVGTSRIGVTLFGFPRGFSGGVTVSDFQRCSRERIGCLNMTRGPAKRITSEIFSRYAGL